MLAKRIGGFEISQLGSRMEMPYVDTPPNIAKGMITDRDGNIANRSRVSIK